jgi:hypothetical protein
VVGFLGTDTNMTIQMYCQSRIILVYCQSRIQTQWSSTSWTLTVAQLVKSIPAQTRAFHTLLPCFLKTNFILYFHLCHSLPSGHFP